MILEIYLIPDQLICSKSIHSVLQAFPILRHGNPGGKLRWFLQGNHCPYLYFVFSLNTLVFALNIRMFSLIILVYISS
jgi:hypothetical protein